MLAIVVVVGVIVAVNSDKTKSLRIFIWEEYIDPECIGSSSANSGPR